VRGKRKVLLGVQDGKREGRGVHANILSKRAVQKVSSGGLLKKNIYIYYKPCII
jgi:hypothetical protein